MFDQLLPQRIDNTYRGHALALWLFWFVVFSKLAIGVNSIFNGRYVATNADGIPLDTFTPPGAQAVVSLFAIWGLAHVLLCVLCILTLVRYRAAVPGMIALVLAEHVIRRIVLLVMPIVTTGSPPGLFVNLGLLLVMVAALVLSLRQPAGPACAPAAPREGAVR